MIHIPIWLFIMIILVLIIFLTLLGARLQWWWDTKQNPDGILCVEDNTEKVKMNFILCLPISDVPHKQRLIFEVKLIPPEETSQ